MELNDKNDKNAKTGKPSSIVDRSHLTTLSHRRSSSYSLPSYKSNYIVCDERQSVVSSFEASIASGFPSSFLDLRLCFRNHTTGIEVTILAEVADRR